ncbi:MAG: NAD+ synthase [Bacteroidia bacterium]|nr:MAG: NAD+ synthase [Bacteroidia bacterium]
MRIALAQLNLHVGNFDHNMRRMLDALSGAKRSGADLVLFPELSVCGYPARDLLLSESFINRCLQTIDHIAGHCNGIAAVVGGPARNTDKPGKSLYNSAFLLFGGKVQFVYNKGLLPTYDVFNEYRYFEPAASFQTFDFGGQRLALTVCEDIWNIGEQQMYPVNPPDILYGQNPSVILNISASPFAWNHNTERMKILSATARKYRLPLFSVNLVGGQTDLLFDGGSAVFNSRGEMTDSLPQFTEDLRVYDLHQVETAPAKPIPAIPGSKAKCRLIMNAIVMGIRDYFRKTGIKKAIVGLSGGIDSAVTLALAVEALGKENVWAVLLPGPYSSDHSVTDAQKLAETLQVRYDVISINDTIQSLEKSLHKHFQNTGSGIAEENIQARARAIILMALSNKFGHLLLNTSNKSEAAVGYSTLYGDMCGGLSVLGDVYKTDVYGIARLINEHSEVIPVNTLHKPPSAELKPNQKDSDSLPAYDILDPILFCFLDEQKDAATIISEGHDASIVKKTLSLICGSEYKRYQTPPILRVSPKCLGVGREMPLEADYRVVYGDN